MMKRAIACLVFAAFFALPALAAAENSGVYVAPRLLLGFQHTGTTNIGDEAKSNYENTFGGALAVGYNFASSFRLPLRAELEYAYRSEAEEKASVDIPGVAKYDMKHKMSISTLFLNAYYDIDTGSAFTPYFGIGFGMAFVDNKWSGENSNGKEFGSGSASTSSFAYNLGLGVSYAFTENVAADLGYRFIGAGYHDGKFKDNYGGEENKIGSFPTIHEIYLGARITF